MGFLKKIGGALGKLPGSKLLTKPINKLAGKTPGLKGMPAAFGMGGPKKPSPIGPSPDALARAAQTAKAGINPNSGRTPMQFGPAPTLPMQGGLPQANAAPPPMAQQLPAMQAPPPEAMPQMMPPQEMTGLQAPMEGPAPQPMPPQMTPAMNNLKQRMMGGNTGVTGGRFGRPSGIGPRFMGQ